MENKHFILSQHIQSVSTRSEMQFAFSKLKNAYDLKTIAYFGLNIKPESVDDPYLVVTYSSDWVEHYKERNYLTIDPVVKQGFNSVLPIDWGTFERSSPRMKTFFGEANEFGIGENGVTIPVRGKIGDRALVTLTSNQSLYNWSKDLTHLMGDFQILAYLIHDKICNIEGVVQREYKLAPRELECLKWACRGKTVSETAIILSISDRTVRFYLDLARSKLNAVNVTHAVSKALTNGLIATI